jgi:hypothetical protein
LTFLIWVGRKARGPGVQALHDLPLLGRKVGTKLRRKDVNEYSALDFVGSLAGEDPCDRAAERVRGGT